MILRPDKGNDRGVVTLLRLSLSSSSNSVVSLHLRYVPSVAGGQLCMVHCHLRSLTNYNFYGNNVFFHLMFLSVLVLGGSGGIGNFAIQLLKAWGACVTSTCSADAIELVAGIGADHVVDYNDSNMKKDLESLGGFDVILDPFGGQVGEKFTSLLSKWKGAVFVTLAPPVLSKTDDLGAGLGLLSAGQSFTSSALQKALCSGSLVSWGFFSPNGPALDYIRSLCQSGMIKPIVQDIFPFSKTDEAYAKLEFGHARGKIVINVADDETTKLKHPV